MLVVLLRFPIFIILDRTIAFVVRYMEITGLTSPFSLLEDLENISFMVYNFFLSSLRPFYCLLF